MFKRFISVCLVILVSISFIPANAYASPTTEIASRIYELSTHTPYSGAVYSTFDVRGSRSGCFATVYALSMDMFGVAIPPQKKNSYGYNAELNLSNNNNWSLVGTALSDTNAVTNLILDNALAGDIIQYEYVNEKGNRALHIAMIYSVNNGEIMVYDNTSDKGTRLRTISWKDGTFERKEGTGLSIYRCNKDLKKTSVTITVFPDMPVLSNMSNAYYSDSAIAFSWNSVARATRYTLYLDKYDGKEYEQISCISNAGSGLTRQLPEGKYRAQLQAVNGNSGFSASTNADYVYFDVLPPRYPGKPQLNDMSSTYYAGSDITFRWNPTSTTTHYNLFYAKKNEDGEYAAAGASFYAASGLTRQFTEGEYRIQLQSVNADAWTEDGSTWAYADADYVYFNVVSRYPGKPQLKSMSSMYYTGSVVSFAWDPTSTTTHYNIYYAKKDENGEYIDAGASFYVESGLTREFSEGSYRVLLQSTNANAKTEDGSTWAYTDADYVYFNVVSRYPGKPQLKGMSSMYYTGSVVTFAWDPTSTTTHYNIYYAKKDENGEYIDAGASFYVESGLTREFSEGSYRVLLQSTNANAKTEDGSTWAYTNAEYIYFDVIRADRIQLLLDDNQGETITGVYDTQSRILHLSGSASPAKPVIVAAYSENGQYVDCKLTIDSIDYRVPDNVDYLNVIWVDDSLNPLVKNEVLQLSTHH